MNVEPCPVCRGENLKPKMLPPEFWVHCDTCGCIGKPGNSPKEAMENWNQDERRK